MRKTPFSFTPKTSVAASATDDVTDIGELLKRRPRVVEPEPLSEPAEKADETASGSAQPKPPTPEAESKSETPNVAPAPSAEFEEKEPEPEFKVPMFDPEGFARTIVDIANMARNWLYPGVYDKIVFNDFERRDLYEVHRKVNTAKKQGSEPELSVYEQELKLKHDELVKAKLKIDFKESERAMIAKKLARHLEKIDWMKRLEKYDWVLILIALEGVRFAELRKIKNITADA